MASHDDSGRETAHLAVRILKGESPASIPFETSSKSVTSLDLTQLKRWNISLDNTPEEANVVRKIHTVWDRHQWLAAGGIILIILLFLLALTLAVTPKTPLQRREKFTPQ